MWSGISVIWAMGLLIVSGSTAWLSGADDSASVATDTVQQVDLGIVFPGQALDQVFRFPNNGPSEWRIGEVHKNCNCVVVDQLPATVPVGDCLTVHLRILFASCPTEI